MKAELKLIQENGQKPLKKRPAVKEIYVVKYNKQTNRRTVGFFLSIVAYHIWKVPF